MKPDTLNKPYTAARLASLAKQYAHFLSDGKILAAGVDPNSPDAIREQDAILLPFESAAEEIVSEVIADFTQELLPLAHRKTALKLGLAAGTTAGKQADAMRAACKAESLAPITALYPPFASCIDDYVYDKTRQLLQQALASHPFATVDMMANAAEETALSKTTLQVALKRILPDNPTVCKGLVEALDKDIQRNFQRQFTAQTDMKPPRYTAK